jgi:Lrp/AsnC family leucine-responsive transcriptional regulator
MERAGVIEGYHATVMESSGLVHALLFIQIAERPCNGPLQWIQSLEGVTSVVSLAGEIDALASITVPGMSDPSALNDRIAASPLILSSKSQVVLRRYGQKGTDH